MAKTANLLVDGLGAPQRVGLLLPLHWQTVALLLGVVATGATAVVGSARDCDAAFVHLPRLAEAGVLDGSVDEVLALSGHPLGAPCGPLPPLVQDYAREVPSYGDHYGGPVVGAPVVEPDVAPLAGLAAADRLLTVLAPEEPGGLAALLGALHAGAGLVLAAGPVDLARVCADERVTAVVGADVEGVRRIG